LWALGCPTVGNSSQISPETTGGRGAFLSLAGTAAV